MTEVTPRWVVASKARWYELLLARLFGDKMVVVSDGYKVVCLCYKGTTYVMSVERA